MVLEKERKKKGEERKKWGGGENEHQSNFSKTEQQNFMYKNILRDFDTWEPYDYIYFNHLLSCAVSNLQQVGGPCPITLINLSSQV